MANNAAPVQRVSRVYVGTAEVSGPQLPMILRYLNQLTRNFAGEVWFNSGQELQDFIQSMGQSEGIGVWNGRWMNFTGKGPIVFGEEHNEIRQEFIDKLHITHYVVEGAFERSLTGVPDANVPAHQTATSHTKYSGAGPGKALENFWVRSAQSMARFWVAFEDELGTVKRDDWWISQIDRPGELDELVRTVAAVTPVSNRAGIEADINAELQRAKTAAIGLKYYAFRELLSVMGQPRSQYNRNVGSVLKKIDWLGAGLVGLREAFFRFRQSIERIGYLQFKANASPEEMEADEHTRKSKNPFDVWGGGRREHFMLANLRHALAQTPPPLLTTMGAAHAKHQEQALEEMLSPYGGRLVIGSIVDLADFGAMRLAPLIEAISFELAEVYGWSERTRREYLGSPEAKSAAEIRHTANKTERPSYIS